MDWASSSFGIAHARASPYRMLYFSLSRVTKTIATKYTIKVHVGSTKKTEFSFIEIRLDRL